MIGQNYQQQNEYREIPLDIDEHQVPEDQAVMTEQNSHPSHLHLHLPQTTSEFRVKMEGPEDGDQSPRNAVNAQVREHLPQESSISINAVKPSVGSTIIGGNRPLYIPRRKNFMQRNCSLCIKLCKWLPVVFILSVLSWGYYAFNIQLCLFKMDSVMLKVVLIVVFHFWYLMSLWSYYQTIFMNPGQPPRDFWLTVQDMERLNGQETEEARTALYEVIVQTRGLPIQARTYSGGFRTCEKCNLLKPDRAHHCSVCDACILKMDHHCPWVNNCVSFTNYKFFVLFLGYSFGLCLYSAAVSFPFFLKFWKNDLGGSNEKLHILFLFFVSIMFAVSLASLFFYHIFLTLKNRSTLESFRTPVFRYGPDKKAYDLGKKRNWKEIFGDSVFFMFLPISSHQGSGIVFDSRLNKVIGEDGYDVEGEGSHPLLASVDDDSRFDDDEEMVTISLRDEDDRNTNGLTIHKESV